MGLLALTDLQAADFIDRKEAYIRKSSERVSF